MVKEGEKGQGFPVKNSLKGEKKKNQEKRTRLPVLAHISKEESFSQFNK